MAAIHYYFISQMKFITSFLLLSLFFIKIFSWGQSTFCSMVCGRNNCNGILSTNCNNNCNTNWIVSGNTCIPNAAQNWYMENASPDLGGYLSISGVGPASTSICGSFNMYGTVTCAQTITITHPGVINPFFQMIVYVGAISIDSVGKGYWQWSMQYSLTLTDGTFSQTKTQKLSSKSNNNQYCYAGNAYEAWNRITDTYNYNTTNIPLTWTLNNNNAPNTSALWGMKQFIIIIRRCNVICLSCYGIAATQCYSCVTSDTSGNLIWQSNNTCSTACLTRFGQVTTSNVCVYCDLRCTACYEISTNCTACTTSGIWSSYLDTTNNVCINPCNTGYFANKATHTCDQCNITCTLCLNSANYCLQCIASYGWAGWTCYQTCPTNYFQSANLSNCTKCSSFCQVCSGPTNAQCTVCTLSGTYIAYLYNTTNLTGTCLRVCPAGYYAQTYGGAGPNLCLACDVSCSLCSGNPSPCSQCSSGYFLYNGVCLSACPAPLFQSNSTGYGLCLDCDVSCVTLSMNMYFPSVLNTQLYVDMIFSQSIDFTTFNYVNFQNITIQSNNLAYTIDMFNISYEILNSNSYRIIIQPKTYIFLYNATFTVTTVTQPSPIDYSTSMMPFKSANYQMTKSTNWFLIYGPPFTPLQVGIMTSFSTLSSKTNNFLDLPYVQQIKKSGIFSLLFSGAQITSCSMLSNQIQSQNMYQGVRFFAIFVFFDAPPYQKISNQTKNIVSPSVQSKIRNAQEVSTDRQLFSTDTMYWRFQRTGQTSFFIYDVYLPMVMIVTCWILMVVAHLCKDKSWYSKHIGKLFSAVHKVHQISIMYVTMAAIVQFLYFQPTSFDRWISAIICVIFNIYFIFYELYIYYDMIRYPLAQIGNKAYDYYVLRYGCFLKNIRFQEYDINQEWSPKHWLRPYNFHILSYYKKFVMMVSLPLFYKTTYAQMIILFIIQLCQALRVWYVWPFLSKRRNYLRLVLQLSLLCFFLVNLIQISLLNQIMSESASTIGKTISIFYGLGWVGFALCLFFNLTHVFIGVYDLCVGFRVTNRQKMDDARKRYYYDKIKDYEKDNEASSKVLVSRWVKLGNLNNRSYGQLPEINIRIQQYHIRSFNNQYEVEVKKITQLKMKSEKNYRKSNNTTAGGKIQKRFILNQSSYPRLYSIFEDLYQEFQSPHVERLVLKTFLNVNQKDYNVGDQIVFDVHKMFQRVELYSYDNQKTEKELPQLLERFPLDEQLFNNLS